MEEPKDTSRPQAEYTPAERQLISHEEALALEFEQLVDELYQRREDRAEARRQFMAGVESLNQPYKPQPMIMSKRDFEDILKYEEGLRMKDSRVMGLGVRRRVDMDRKPAPTVKYTKRNRKSKK